MIARALAYAVCAVPAAIGVWFVARYAYATSDTLTDAYSNAFLFGMIAVGAYACPALAIAIGRRNRRAAAFFWFAALLAIAVNWSNTLGAISDRGAGMEAERAKAAKAIKDADRRLDQIDAELARLPLVIANAEAVAAAEEAVKAASRATQAECGNGDPRQRGAICRTKEADEQRLRDALARLVADKASSDLRERLSTEAADIRMRQAQAPAVREANSLGSTLGKLVPSLDAETASAAQHGLMSLIVELLIAAFLALPGLLLGTQSAVAVHGNDAIQNRVLERAHPLPVSEFRILGVADYAAKRLMPSERGRVSVDRLYADYRCVASQLSMQALTAADFAAGFARLCEGTPISAAEEHGVVYLSKLRIAHAKPKQFARIAETA